LAARSAKAAKDTGIMINSSNHTVDIGIDIAGKTSSTLTQVEFEMEKVNNLVKSVSEYSFIQDKSITEILSSLKRLNYNTEENKENFSELSGASRKLSSTVYLLKNRINSFKTKGYEI
jgi:methyl-accepting chemotaxis protein